MDVRPADLGDRWHIAVVRMRAGSEAESMSVPRIGRLGRRWIRGLGISDTVAEQTLPASAGIVLGSSYGGVLGGASWIPVAGAILSLVLHNAEIGAAAAVSAAGVGWLAFEDVPRRIIRWLHSRPLNDEDVRALREATARAHNISEGPTDIVALIGDRLRSIFGPQEWRRPVGDENWKLEEEFLALVSELIATQFHSVESEAELRHTLNLLGSAVSDLPIPPGIPDTDDTADLVADAEMLLARANREPDRVVADSLVRQAEAKAAQARALHDARRITRQTRVLREELRAQIAATRAALPSLAQARAVPGSGTLRRVADSVQAVTREAAAVVAAREELAAALGEAIPASATSPLSSASGSTAGTVDSRRQTPVYGAQPAAPVQRLRNGRQ